jgi:hypothetical protein
MTGRRVVVASEVSSDLCNPVHTLIVLSMEKRHKISCFLTASRDHQRVFGRFCGGLSRKFVPQNNQGMHPLQPVVLLH